MGLLVLGYVPSWRVLEKKLAMNAVLPTHPRAHARTVAACVLLPGWDASDPQQQRLMAQHLYGDGAARTPTIAEDLAMFEAVGFRVEEHYDFANPGHQIYGGEAAVPWWGDLQPKRYFSLLPVHHPWVRWCGARCERCCACWPGSG